MPAGRMAEQMRMAFESEEARALNRDIFETMYFAAMTASCELAEKEGCYETFQGSPLSEGKFQFDLWGQVRARVASCTRPYRARIPCREMVAARLRRQGKRLPPRPVECHTSRRGHLPLFSSRSMCSS